MRLLSLSAEGFRNLAPFRLSTDARFVVFHGENAQGKTNILESVWFLATLKPLRGRRPRELVCWDGDRTIVSGQVSTDGIVGGYRVELADRTRRASIDGKNVSRLSEYFQGVRVVAFTPSDGAIVTGEPALRRRWLDRAVFTASPGHLDLVRTYRRVLSQKSAALRSDTIDLPVLDALDHQLASVGARLVTRRLALLDSLKPAVRDVYAEIAGGGRLLRLGYRTVARGADEGERVQALTEALHDARPRELARRMTLVGPHRDDVQFGLAGHSARAFGSRGQVRSLVLSLKLAELVAARDRGQVPIFLLDDLSSELDRKRTGHLVRVLEDLGTQVFVTTTDPEHLEGLPEGHTLRVRVQGGRLTSDDVDVITVDQTAPTG